MSNAPSSVVVHGRTPAGAACAAALARTDVAVQLVGAAGPGGEIGLVSDGVLRALCPIESVTHQHIETVIDRRLHEDDADDSLAEAGDLLTIRRSDLVSALLRDLDSRPPEQLDDQAVHVDAAELVLGSRQVQDDEFLPLGEAAQSVHLEWPRASGTAGRWIRLTGETLSDVDGSASIIVTAARTTLLVTVPTASLVNTSIALADILARLMSHPAVRAEIPAIEPDAGGMRLLKTGNPRSLSLGGGICVDIGAAAGLADPIVLDVELRSGIIAGEQIAAAFAANRVSIAQLSRMGREWKGQDIGGGRRG